MTPDTPGVDDATDLSSIDERWLARSIDDSRRARDDGRHPFAALVVDSAGTVIGSGLNNSRPPEGDPTQHAELVAAAAAYRATAQNGTVDLSTATLYTSAEPCAMCSGAIYWTGIGRVVYALSETRLLSITGDDPENPTLSLPCRDVFAHGQREIAVVGPAMEDESAAVHEGFWTGGSD